MTRMLISLPHNLRLVPVLTLILVTSFGAHAPEAAETVSPSLMNEPEQVELLVPDVAAVRQDPPRVILMEVTAYCPCKKCCGPKAKGVTASGRHVSYNGGRFVAADTTVLPFGTRLQIPGYGDAPVEVIDRGGAIKGNKLDVFYDTHEEALEWGRQHVVVTVVE